MSHEARDGWVENGTDGSMRQVRCFRWSIRPEEETVGTARRWVVTMLRRKS
jgi:hypothetical protein